MSDFKPIRGDLTDAKSTLTHDKTCSLNVGHGSRSCDCHMAVIAHSNQRIAELEAQHQRLVELLKTSVAEFDDGIKYPLEVVNDLKQTLDNMETT